MQSFQGDLIAFLERWLPSLVRSNRSYLTVAVGCTGGQHRSVHLAERLAAHFQWSPWSRHWFVIAISRADATNKT